MEDKNTVYMSEKQKVKEITDKLEAGLKELFESEKYKSYLSTMSKFHNYSFNNTLLIAMQKPEATLVAGYQAWQKNFERHVNKGEKAIRILAPAPYKIKEERDKLDRGMGIGTLLLTQMLLAEKAAGYAKISLSVQKDNYAVKLYRKAGFTTVKETTEEYIMVADLNSICKMEEENGF